MPTIEFKTKIQTMYGHDEKPLYRFIEPPRITKEHCNMHGFRTSAAFGGIANSDMFPCVLTRIQKSMNLDGVVNIDATLDSRIHVDDSGFLAKVTVDVPDDRSLLRTKRTFQP